MQKGLEKFKCPNAQDKSNKSGKFTMAGIFKIFSIGNTSSKWWICHCYVSLPVLINECGLRRVGMTSTNVVVPACDEDWRPNPSKCHMDPGDPPWISGVGQEFGGNSLGVSTQK